MRITAIGYLVKTKPVKPNFRNILSAWKARTYNAKPDDN
jgi:hypothetical protein